MAYKSNYNPDALPPHVEPEQAAQLLSSQQPQQTQQLPPSQQPQQLQPQQQQQQPLHNRNYSSPPQTRPHAYSNPYPYNNAQPQYQYQNKPTPPLPGHQAPPQQQLQPPLNNRPPPNPAPPGSWNNSYSNLQPQNYSQAPSLADLSLHEQKRPYNGQSPPPPHNYGHGPPPTTHNRPPPPSRPPGTPAPPSSSNDASLFPLFKAVDKSGTGQLTERELGRALVNGDFTQFDSHTVKMMIRMFDSDKDGSVNFEEFCGLWSFLAAWRALFDRFDEDSSGSISFEEYTNAIVAFGYRLSSSFVQLLYSTYDKSGQGKMSFDLFVQSCIILKRMTDVFKRYDEDRDGYITLSFEEFLTEILRQR